MDILHIFQSVPKVLDQPQDEAGTTHKVEVPNSST